MWPGVLIPGGGACSGLTWGFPPPAAFLQELVERDNSRFEEWCCEMAEMRKQSVARGRVKHEEVKELYQRLPAKAGL